MTRHTNHGGAAAGLAAPWRGRQRARLRSGERRTRLRRGGDRARLRTGDLVSESLAGILGRPGRTALTLVGVVLGIAAFVSILGLTSTASGQISRRFTELVATEVTVEDLTASDAGAATTGTAFPPDGAWWVVSWRRDWASCSSSR